MRKVGALLSILALLVAPFAFAADSLTVSVTPPLFQLALGPGEFWASSIKVVNTNSYDVDYYASPVNFEPVGERGTGNFKPIIDSFGNPQDVHTLANWITITREPIHVAAGQSVDIPFDVKIPTDAEPGGHYAAVLVGTQPPHFEGSGPQISVSSYVSSLFFVKIRGDVHEEGRIREFTTDSDWYERPEAKFVVRFENTGTVHVRPVGDIVIYNMWGKERGTIEINQQSTFGNVLPKSVRRFEFAWNGEFSPLDIGRYKAELTLGYGDEVKRNVTAVAYFWVVPVVPVLSTIGGFLTFVLVTVYFIRRYIRRVLRAEQLHAGVVTQREVPRPRVAQNTASTKGFLKKHVLLVAFLIYLGVSAAVFAWYFGEALVDSRTYTVEELKAEGEYNTAIPEND